MYCHIHHCHYHHCHCVPKDSKEKGGALTQEELLTLTEEMKDELKDYTVDLKDQIFSYIDIGLNPVEIANTFASLKEQDTYILRTLTNKIDELNNTTNLSMFNLRARVTDLEGHSANLIQDLTDRTQRIVELEGYRTTNSIDLIDRTQRIEELETNTQVVESVADLATIENPKDGLRVYVKSYHTGLGKGGGYFTYDESKASINDTGVVLNGWVRDYFEYATPEMFGAKGDNLTDDTTLIQKAINYMHENRGGGTVVLSAASYYVTSPLFIRDSIHLKGQGSHLTKLNIKDASFNVLRTPSVTEYALSVTEDFKEGIKEYNINNTCKKGDLFRISSDAMLTERWTSKNEYTKGYREGELFELSDCTESSVNFYSPSWANAKLSRNAVASYFTPIKNIKVEGLSIIRESTQGWVIVTGITISNVSTAHLSDIFISGFEYAGIAIDKSVNVTGTQLTVHGGSNNTSSNYGIVLTNGSKNCILDTIYTKNCSSGVAAVGDGYASPSRNTISNFVIEKSQSLSFNTSPGCAYFNYSNGIVDNGFQISGLGHRVDNIQSISTSDIGVWNNIAGGGYDLNFSNILLSGCQRFFSAYEVKHSSFRNLKIIASKSFQGTWLALGSSHNQFNGITLEMPEDNPDWEGSITSLSAARGIGGLLGSYSTMTNVRVLNMPKIMYINGNHIIVDNVIALNSGWRHSIEGIGVAAGIFIVGSHITVSNVRVYNNTQRSNITWSAPAVGIHGSSERDITLSNIRSVKGEEITDNNSNASRGGLYSSGDIEDLVLLNCRMALIEDPSIEITNNISPENITYFNTNILTEDKTNPT